MTECSHGREFWVEGRPATFETRGESGWKDELSRILRGPECNQCRRPGGLELDFSTSSSERNGQRFDLDNLCEPVFAVLVGDLGWFPGPGPRYRTAVRWFRATKRVAVPDGCRLTLWPSQDVPPSTPWASEREDRLLEGVYAGGLPKHSARSDSRLRLASWAAAEMKGRPRTAHVAVRIVFGDQDISIASIVTGYTKRVIDCLYPLLGGTPEQPADHRVGALEVAKTDGVPSGAVAIDVWQLEDA